MPVIVANKVIRYGRKDQQPGDSFEASEKDANFLVKIGKARLSDAVPPKAVNLPKEVMSRAPVKEVVEDEAPKPKRAYHRRDMTAEESKPVSPMTYHGPTGEDE